MPCFPNFKTRRLGMQAQVDEFVEQYAESTKRVIDRECSDVKKHEQELVENAEALAWHEESVVMELHRELQQARLQVSGAQAWRSSSRDSWSLLLWSPCPSALVL